jgi:hypothetical protein
LSVITLIYTIDYDIRRHIAQYEVNEDKIAEYDNKNIYISTEESLKNFLKIQTLLREKPHDFDFGKLERYLKRHTDSTQERINAEIKHLELIRKIKAHEITERDVIQYI